MSTRNADIAAALFDTLRLQAPFMVEFKVRDYAKRVVTSTYVMVVLALYVDGRLALSAFALIQTIEYVRMRHMRALPKIAAEVTHRQAIHLLFLDLLSTTVHCLISLPLVASGTVVGLLLGMMWLFSVSLHNIAGLALIKVWCWASLVPVAVVNLWAVYLIHHQSFTSTGPWDGVVVAIGALMYTGNMVEVTVRQRQNRQAFATARRSAEERLVRLEYLARHDAMTGLMNRRAFDEALSDALLAGDGRNMVGIVIIDLDGFKAVNDNFGHSAGDAVLVEVARRIDLVFGPGHGARLGGDEFAVLLTGDIDPAAATTRAGELHARLHEAVAFEDETLKIGASLGIAFGQRGETATQLFSRADAAMYRGKSERLGRPVMADARTRVARSVRL